MELACEPTVGLPPPGASLVFRGHLVLVYLPKYCILDQKIAGHFRLTKPH
jgi:hypothetical protein